MVWTRRLLFAITAALIMLVGTQGARSLMSNRVPQLPEARSGDTETAYGTWSSSTDTYISLLQERIRTRPPESQPYDQLGVAYLQKARETADPAYYIKADGVLQKALELQPHNDVAMTAMGTLALTCHQFKEALNWSV